MRMKCKQVMLAGLSALVAVALVSCDIVGGATGGRAPVIEEEVPRAQASWTLLVYMAAESSLEGQALVALNQLEAGLHEDADIHVVALVDRSAGFNTSDGNWTGTRLYEVLPDDSAGSLGSRRLGDPVLGIPAAGDVEKDLSDPVLFSDFLAFGARYFPSQHTALVLWGYSEGITGENYAQSWAPATGSASFGSRALGYDETFSRQLLSVRAIGEGVAAAGGFDIVAFDAPMTGLVEFAFEFVGAAAYYAGSQDSLGASKWNYGRLLELFLASSLEVEDLLSAVEQAYSETAVGQSASLSVVETSGLDDVAAKFSEFADAVAGSIDQSNIHGIRSDLFYLQDWGYVTPGDLQLDIANLAACVAGKGLAVAEASALVASLDAAVYSTWNKNEGTAMSGLSVFFTGLGANGAPLGTMPGVYCGGSGVGGSGGVPGLRFAAVSGWGEVLGRIWEGGE